MKLFNFFPPKSWFHFETYLNLKQMNQCPVTQIHSFKNFELADMKT